MRHVFIWMIATLTGFSTAALAEDLAQPFTLKPPDGRLRVTFKLGELGRPAFDVAYRDVSVAAGTLLLEFAGSGPLRENMKVIGTQRKSHDETYAIPV